MGRDEEDQDKEERLLNGADEGVDEAENEEEEGVEVEFEYGAMIFQSLNGEGYHLRVVPVHSGRVLREATPDDIISLIGKINAYNQAMLCGDQVMKMLKSPKIVKPKGGIFARGK